MKLQIGVMAGMERGVEESLNEVAGQGFSCCQLCCWDVRWFSEENAAVVRKMTRRHRLTVTTLWAGYPGPAKWNFMDGPSTIGLVPDEWRSRRVRALKAGADFARSCGIPSITTHAGFIPENPRDRAYRKTLRALREVAGYCRARGLSFWFETGQETPVTLLRTIQDLGLDNLGINLDPANLILYGKANPVDALDVIGRYVRGVHAKDAVYPTDGRSLGKEMPLGGGKVKFRRLVPKLYALGFRGALTIEREISGAQQIKDIRLARRALEAIVAKL